MTNNTLHLIRCSAFDSNKLVHCLASLDKNDSVLLIDDGCYNLNHPIFKEITASISSQHAYVLANHMVARAIHNIESINTVSYQEFSQLIINHHNVITWQ